MNLKSCSNLTPLVFLLRKGEKCVPTRSLQAGRLHFHHNANVLETWLVDVVAVVDVFDIRFFVASSVLLL